jgi:hypothetical protein
MLSTIDYRGILIQDTGIAGERRADHAVPNVAAVARLSRDRWLVACNTVDDRGCDANRGITWELRADTPDGPVVRRGVFLRPDDHLDPLRTGRRFWRGYSTPRLFGVPKGAMQCGVPRSNANAFVLTWSSKVRANVAGRLIEPTPGSGWPSDFAPDVFHATRQAIPTWREGLQFRLSEREDDLDITVPRYWLRQRGDEAFCAHGPGIASEPWCQPVREDDGAFSWLETVSLQPQEYVGPQDASRFTTLRHTWNSEMQRYAWTDTGAVHVLPGMRAGEPSLVRLAADDWIIAIRCFSHGGQTLWYRLRDPLGDFGPGTAVVDAYSQRVALRGADGGLYLLINNLALSPYGHKRNPLFCFAVDPDGFAYHDRRVVFDACAAGLPIDNPFVDHVAVLPPVGPRQGLPLRVIDLCQVWNPGPDTPPLSPASTAATGVHYAELVYDRVEKDEWEFAEGV